MDPHKRSVTIVARDGREVLRATGTFPVSSTGYRSMLRFARQWPDRVWAMPGHRERTLEPGEVERLGRRGQRDASLDGRLAEAEPRDVLGTSERERRVDLVADHRHVVVSGEGRRAARARHV
jgi:hypothetical protein